MEAQNTIEPITMVELIPQVLRFKLDGWRVIQICACRIPRALR